MKAPTAAAALPVGYGAIYLATRTRFPAPETTPADPHHLLAGALHALFHELLRAFFPSARPVLSAQILNAILGGIGVWFFYRVARRLSGDDWFAGIAAFGLGASLAWWSAATSGGLALPGAVLAVLALGMTVLLLSRSPRWMVPATGVVAGLAVSFDTVHRLLLPVVLAGALLAKQGQTDRTSRALISAGSWGAAVIIPYVVAQGLTTGRFSPTRMLSWLFGGSILAPDVAGGFIAFLRGIMDEKPYRLAQANPNAPFDHGLAVFEIFAILAIVALLLWGIVNGLRRWEGRRATGICLLGGLCYGLALAEGNTGAVLMMVVAFWGTAAMTIGSWKPPDLFDLPKRSLLVVGVAVVFVVNCWYSVLPGMRAARDSGARQAISIASLGLPLKCGRCFSLPLREGAGGGFSARRE